MSAKTVPNIPDGIDPDLALRAAVERIVGVEAQDRDHEGCSHPRDLHWRYGCGAEHCDCSYVPPAMNLVEAVRILNADRGDRQGWLR